MRSIRFVSLTASLAALACGPTGRIPDFAARDSGATPPSSDAAPSPPGCSGLLCQIASCPAGKDTVLTGRVFAPNGTDPVPGAQVYVPNLGLPEFPSGVSCDLCNNIGAAAAQAQTSFDGSFKLTHVPSGNGIPLVIQLGRFRRVLTLSVTACTQKMLPPDAGSMGVRLPHRDAEFNGHDSVPHVAVATGDYDQIECVLQRMGLGQFDLYADRDPGQPPATVGTLQSLLTNKTRLLGYNILVVNCTNNQYESIVAQPGVRQNLAAFISGGGRLYATDWAYDTIAQIPEFAPYLCFEPQQTGGAPMCGGGPATPEAADTRSPYSSNALVKDPGLADWLAQFPGVIDNTHHVAVDFSFVVIDAVATNKSQYPTNVWVEGDTANYGTRPLTVTFDYHQCGRVHFSTYNTEPNGVVPDGQRYPNCKPDFSPQERILEYLVFEIANCVGPPS